MARLLIVEDNQELASLIATVAQTRGHEALTVFTGESALEALGPTTRFDAALVDLLLPDIRGSEVLGALRAHAIPAIAVSGVYKGDRFAQEAIKVHGACAFFEKPFELDAVLNALEEAAGVPPVTHGELLDEVDLLVLEELVQETPSQEEPALESVDAAAGPSEPSEPALPEEAPGVSEALPLPFA
ncbi:response regulator, partial [Corallococcus sp. 4LFB]|uniref:response regulator n=1 Tax=Corallococcus sp. 4LFB TaxID=3383249 RepID=UPI0039756587